MKSWPPCKSGQSLSSPGRGVVVCITPPLYIPPPKPLVQRLISLRRNKKRKKTNLLFFCCYTAHRPNLKKHLSALQKKRTRDRFEKKGNNARNQYSSPYNLYQKKIQLQLTSIGEEQVVERRSTSGARYHLQKVLYSRRQTFFYNLRVLLVL